MTHKAPRTPQDGREAPEAGIAYLSVPEVALRLRLHRNTVEGWYRFRGLPVVKVGRTVRIRDVDLHDWLAHAIVTCGGATGDTEQHRESVPASERRQMDRVMAKARNGTT